MPIRCAWCGRQIGEDPRLTGDSHGICGDCAEAKFSDEGPESEQTSQEGGAS
jgi:hypothetical protein